MARSAGALRTGKTIYRRFRRWQRAGIWERVLRAALERMWPDAVAGDKAYSAAELRAWLDEREIVAVIPQRADERGPNDSNREAYRERMFNRLKRYRRIATRYEQLAHSYIAMITVASILEWL